MGLNLLKKIHIISAGLLLSGCGIMPGMQNLDTSRMRSVSKTEQIKIYPTLIPITPKLISDQHISTYHYLVAPADVLHINVWQHPEFNFVEQQAMATTAVVQGAAGQAGFLVNSTGYIYFPLIGQVKVSGKTVDRIRQEMATRLQKYIPNPQLNVRVADFRGQKIYVLGEVVKPGFLPINDQPLNMADALALSGGMDPNSANPRFVYVIRGNYVHPQIFWLDAKTPDRMLLAERFHLLPRDILFVSSAPATRWNRVLNQVLPTVQAIWYTQAIVRNS